jgi:hypothetical protein
VGNGPPPDDKVTKPEQARNPAASGSIGGGATSTTFRLRIDGLLIAGATERHCGSGVPHERRRADDYPSRRLVPA